MNLKPYLEYKDSGAPWLGKVPQEWDFRKTKYLFNERVEKGFPNEPLLAATQTKGVVPKSHYETRTVTAQKDFHLLKLVKKNDFVISLRSFQGGIELAYFQGIISPAYTIMIPHEIISIGYFKNLAKSKPFIKMLTTCVTGIREGQNIDYELLKRNKLPLPPLAEQTHIARFLDWKTVQITKFIKDKKRMIELLKEQKQVIINDAVTGKIDVATGKPYAKYKESGVEWLGRVPEGWAFTKIIYYTQVKDGTHDTPLYVEPSKDTFPLITSKVFYNGFIDFQKAKHISGKDHFDIYKRSNTEKNDILMSMIGGNIGSCVLVETNEKFSIKNVCLYKTAHSKNLSPLFLYYTLSSFQLMAQIQNIEAGGGQPFIGLGDLRAMKFLFPKIAQQEQIVAYIENQTNSIHLAISRTEREIALMQEYRDRLIADVVTGKVDVRSIDVPDVVEEISLEEIESVEEEVDEIEEAEAEE